ncbi:PAS domain S-box protein [Paenibacillus sp. CC-CFT747]|nr:PAS domain S-box protein [Paenibacillus sp. CC-CFT747]
MTDEELVKLSDKLDVSHISLLQRRNDDIVVVKSSDPKAVNKGVKELGYWYTALDQLMASHIVTVPQGQKLANFWSGPLEISTTDPDHINKWGYYNDGSRDYIVSPFLKGNFLEEFNRVTGPETLVNKLLKENPMFFEMTGFNPEYFGRDSTYSLSDGTKLTPEARKPIRFGTYQLPDARDEAEIRRVHEEGRSLMTEGNLADGRRVIKSFIPIPGSRPLVIGIVTDSAAVYGVLKEQLVKHIFISLLLLAIIVATSYLFADYFIRPLDRILEKVNRIAAGDFGPPVTIRGTDEFSLLADRVNVMSGNLEASTARLKETVEELNSTKQYLESFITNTSDSIQVVDLEGRTILTNQAFETMYGWDANEARGERLPLVPEDRLAEMGRINNLVKEGGQVTDVETVHRRKNGSCFDVSTTVSPIRGSRGEVVAVASISRDITGRKQTEEMLRRSEKLSVVGQLAAGVAHEIRNPLTTLRGFVQLQKEGGVRKPAHLELMLSELDRINFIVSEFMVLSKPHVQSFSRKDLGQILRDIVALLEPQAIMANVVLVTEFESGIPEVECVENQLKQVFVNLVKNGLEAMDEGES